eukprot:364804-Chlamydomonas_euryale.AAC.9
MQNNAATTEEGATFRHQAHRRSRQGPAQSRSRRVLPGAAATFTHVGRAIVSGGTAVSCGTRIETRRRGTVNTPFLST